MKLKHPLHAALEITQLDFQITHCNKVEIIAKVITFAGLIALILAGMSSCTLTVHPDGSRTYGIDGEQAVRAIEIYSAK